MKKIMILYTVIILLIIVVPVLILFILSNNNCDYSDSKKEVTDFLNSNEDELIVIIKDAIDTKDKTVRTFKDKEYYYSVNDNKEIVTISINSQGMLGGHYWDLIYCECDYLNGKTIDIYDEHKETGKGNNIFIVEKIKDNWFFSYQDWDGKTNIKGGQF